MEPLQLSLGVFGTQPHPLPCVCERTTHGHHRLLRAMPPPPATSHMRCLTGRPETKPRQLGFRFLAPNPCPLPCVCEWTTHDHHRLIQATPPPLIISHPHCLTWQIRNRATVARFSGFRPQPHPHLMRLQMDHPLAAFALYTPPPSPPPTITV
jgi:hypothetical protein